MTKPTLHVLVFRSNPEYRWNAAEKAPQGMQPDETWEGIDFNLAGYYCEDDDQCINDSDFAMICACAAKQHEKLTGLMFFIPHYRKVC